MDKQRPEIRRAKSNPQGKQASKDKNKARRPEDRVSKDSQQAEAGFSRWALFEHAVLAKVEDPNECMKVIARRQLAVDADSGEADLVASFLQRKLMDCHQDPELCCIFFTTAEITQWLQEAIGVKLPINKTTPYLRTLSIAELRYSKKDGVPGWVWRGGDAPAGATATMFSKLPCMRRDI